MHLSFDEVNTLALLLEQKKGALTLREVHLFKRVQKYFSRSLRHRAELLGHDSGLREELQKEYEKDFEEEIDGRYR